MPFGKGHNDFFEFRWALSPLTNLLHKGDKDGSLPAAATRSGRMGATFPLYTSLIGGSLPSHFHCPAGITQPSPVPSLGTDKAFCWGEEQKLWPGKWNDGAAQSPPSQAGMRMPQMYLKKHTVGNESWGTGWIYGTVEKDPGQQHREGTEQVL